MPVNLETIEKEITKLEERLGMLKTFYAKATSDFNNFQRLVTEIQQLETQKQELEKKKEAINAQLRIIEAELQQKLREFDANSVTKLIRLIQKASA